MDKHESWKSDLLRLGFLAGLCLLIGVHLIRQTVLIARDGVFYIGQAQQVAADWTGAAERYPAGYPVLLWAAHAAALRWVGQDSTMLWIQSSQAVTLACRVLALIPLYFLGKLLVGGRHSFWALLILIVLPYPARYGSDVLREWPYLLFLGLGLWLLLWALRRQRWWALALVGLVAGLGYTIRPESAQLVIYGLVGVAFVARRSLIRAGAGWLAAGAGSEPPVGVSDGESPTVRAWRGPELLLAAGFLVPVVPYVYATGSLVPHQLRPAPGGMAPVISAVGSLAASDDPLEFEVAPGQLLELPIRAADPDGDPLTLSLAGVPRGARPVYEFRSPSLGTYFWTASEFEKHFLLTTYSREVWSYAGIAFYAYGQADAQPGLLAAHRFWFPTDQRHFYTVSEPEARAIVEKSPEGSWQHEGIAFYVLGGQDRPSGTVPVHRFWSPEKGYHWAVGDGDAHPADRFGAGDARPQVVGSLPPSASASAPSSAPAPARLLFPDPQADTRASKIVWHVPLGGEPPAGAAIEDRVFRWRPGPGQEGEYGVNIIASDGDLQSCQLVTIRVVGRPGPEGARQKTEDSGPRTHDGGRKTEDSAGLHPQYAGLEKLPEAVKDLFAGVAEDLMFVFFVPWLLGLYYRLRHPVEPVERILVFALIVVNVTLVLSRHIGFEGGEDRRYSLALVALTIFYVPLGLELLARWLANRTSIVPRWRGSFRQPVACVTATPGCEITPAGGGATGTQSRGHDAWPWFHLLVVVGLAVCTPKLLMSGRTDKTGYRAAAAWLRQNTQAQDILAVPDSRLGFYAERPGLLYTGYPDSRRADVVVVVGRDGEFQPPQGWHREYSVPVSPQDRKTIVLYTTARRK